MHDYRLCLIAGFWDWLSVKRQSQNIELGIIMKTFNIVITLCNTFLNEHIFPDIMTVRT